MSNDHAASGHEPIETPSELNTPAADITPLQHQQPGPNPEGPPKVFYAIDSLAVPFAEAMRSQPVVLYPVVAIIFLICRLLKIRLPSSSDDPNVESLDAFELPIDTWLASATPKAKSAFEALQKEGFTPVFQHVMEDALNAVRTRMLTLTHPGHACIARVHEREWFVHQPPKVSVFVEFISRGTMDRCLWTTSAKPDMPAPESCTVVRDVKADAVALLHRHMAELPRVLPNGGHPVRDADDARRLANAHHAQIRDFHLARGVFKPIEGDFLKKHITALASHAALPNADFQQRVIYAEMNRILLTRKGRLAGAMILLISMGAFYAAGHHSFKDHFFLISLVLVLFIHEIGHFVVMKIFGYRDLRMFFLPMLGAAVAGRPMTATGWKRALVALAGPVPGIALAAPLTVAAVVTGNEPLISFTIICLILNGLNLLPFLPLDGGHVVAITLTSRHFLLDIAFRVLGLIALGLMALGLHDQVLGIICGVILISLFTAFRLGRITHQIRSQLPPAPAEGPAAPVVAADKNAPPTPESQLVVPPALASEILPRLLAAFPKRTNRKALATNAIGIFEAVHAKPPNALVSIGLLGLHAGAFAMAFFLAIALTIATRPGLIDAFRAGLLTGQHRYAFDAKTPVNIADLPAPLAADQLPTSPQTTVIANFDSIDTARAALAGARAKLQGNNRADTIGRAVLVSFPDDDKDAIKECVAHFQNAPKGVIVQREYALRGAYLSCKAPDEKTAQRIDEELNRYNWLQPTSTFIPPWQPDDTRPPELREAHERARKTFAKLQSPPPSLRDDPKITALNKQAVKANAVADYEQAARIQKQIIALWREALPRYRESLRKEPGMDPVVIDAFIKQQEAFEFSTEVDAESDASGEGGQELQETLNERRQKAKKAAEEFRQTMRELAGGAAETSPGKLTPAAQAIAGSAYVTLGGVPPVQIEFRGVMFQQPLEGLPALIRWLAKQGCTDFKCDFETSAGIEGAADDSGDD